jgi:hypothetical protein
MKKLAIGLLAVIMFLNACKKDNPPPAGSFIVGGQTGETPYGYFLTNHNGSHEIDLTTLRYNDSTYAGIVNFVYFDIDTLVDGATYSYLPKDSSAYDKAANFSDGYVAFGSQVKDRQIDSKTGKYLGHIQGGTIRLQKLEDQYQVDYSIRFIEGLVTGKFVGKLENVQVK